MRTLRFHVNGIERRATGHEQPVPLGAAEADIGADLRQSDQANSVSIGRKYVHTVIPVTNPARTGLLST